MAVSVNRRTAAVRTAVPAVSSVRRIAAPATVSVNHRTAAVRTAVPAVSSVRRIAEPATVSANPRIAVRSVAVLFPLSTAPPDDVRLQSYHLSGFQTRRSSAVRRSVRHARRGGTPSDGPEGSVRSRSVPLCHICLQTYQNPRPGFFLPAPPEYTLPWSAFPYSLIATSNQNVQTATRNHLYRFLYPLPCGTVPASLSYPCSASHGFPASAVSTVPHIPAVSPVPSAAPPQKTGNSSPSHPCQKPLPRCPGEKQPQSRRTGHPPQCSFYSEVPRSSH